MRNVEVFSAGCSCCDEAVQAVKAAACSNCNVVVRDMKDPTVAADARLHGIHRVPAVVIDGKLADCCLSGEINVELLRSMGLGGSLGRGSSRKLTNRGRAGRVLVSLLGARPRRSLIRGPWRFPASFLLTPRLGRAGDDDDSTFP